MNTFTNKEISGKYIEMEEYNIETGEIREYYMPDEDEEDNTCMEYTKFDNHNVSKDIDDDSVILGSIIGKDTREIVEETTRVPYKYIGYIVVTYQSTNSGAYSIPSTAFLVGHSTILTTAHSVHNKNKDDKLVSIKFYPEQNGYTNRPFEYDGYKLHVPKKYKNATTNEAKLKYDYALVELKQKAGSKLGYFNLAGYNTSYNENYLVGKDVTVVGYAEDKNGKLCRSKGPVLRFNEGNYSFEYDMDTNKRQSGSPIILPLSGGKYYVVGIHYLGKEDTSKMNEEEKKKAVLHNRARYITKNIYDLVKKYSNGTNS